MDSPASTPQPTVESFPLVGIYRVRKDAPGFGICLVRMDGGRLAAQCVDDNDRVTGFASVNTEGSIIAPVSPGPGDEPYRLISVADPLLYAYQRNDLTFAIGTRSEIEAAVRADLPNIRHLAFLWEEAAAFINDEAELALALAETARLLTRK